MIRYTQPKKIGPTSVLANAATSPAKSTYHDVRPTTKEDAEQAFQSANAKRIVDALLAVSYFEPDWRWVQDHCLAFLDSHDPEVCATAITCLGHLARIHRQINRRRVLSALQAKRRATPILSGRIGDAIEDIQLFAPGSAKSRHDRGNGQRLRKKSRPGKANTKKK